MTNRRESVEGHVLWRSDMNVNEAGGSFETRRQELLTFQLRGSLKILTWGGPLSCLLVTWRLEEYIPGTLRATRSPVGFRK